MLLANNEVQNKSASSLSINSLQKKSTKTLQHISECEYKEEEQMTM